MPAPAISFCTCCFNRAHQLKQVFEANAAAVAADRELEWIILNYASEDDLDEFLRARLPAVSRRIVYARETTRRPWHVSIAKNMAHRLGSGAVLMNLDCDNYIGNAPEVIRILFAQGTRMLHLRSEVPMDGSYGRLALARDVFHALGGYDEELPPMGWEDNDLMARGLASGLGQPAWLYPSPPGSSIPNSQAEKVRYCSGRSWPQLQRASRARSRRNLAAKRYIANSARGWCAMAPVIARGGSADRGPARRRGPAAAE